VDDVLFLKSTSISSKLRPLVSGRYLITNIIAKIPITAKIKNTSSILNTDVSIGNNSATNKLPIDSDNVAIPVAAPLALIGNNSGSITHNIGPQVNAKNTINSVRQATIIQAPTVEPRPIVHTNPAIISNDPTIPMLPVINSFFLSILSMI